DFPDFTGDELFEIGQMMLEAEHYCLSEDARGAFHDYLCRRMRQPRFANARSVRNAIDRMRLRQAKRLVSSENTKVRKDDLMRLETADISGSRVFEQSAS
ncbi:MAG: CbbX protein, partial [Sciscionella sp.]